MDRPQSMMVPAAMSAGLRKPGTPWKNRTVTLVTQDIQKLHENGWVFLFSERLIFSQRERVGNVYAFAKILPGGAGMQTYDIAGFLQEMEREGRGPLPAEDLVREFENLLAVTEVPLPKELLDAPEDIRESFPTRAPPMTLFDNDAALKYMKGLLPATKVAARTVLGL
ncbi:hypothetical protein BT96DRAFT_479467 [Gymnopus androsaceus JB14]|uniref:Uncharacterized protein n=1 Tax=Gymnopus androsaceus JB14 TaxID=1447944 RepID=A0A6A4I0W0_9AGAR|nr:hypothetical protein BT96DRAFT_479467 [Gymnopus androsaceus JB14]